jgi:hypothetical protein
VTGRAADQRAEILGMIARLGARRAVEDQRRRTAKPPSAHPVKSAPRETVTQPPASKLETALQAVELRLARIEEQLNRTAKPAAAPPGVAAHGDATLSGLLKGQLLSDVLQLVSSNQLSGVFVIESEVGTCTMYLFEGRIRHAVGDGGLVGEEAFFAAFASQDGRYHFTETLNLPEETSVSSGTQYLVLEALRRMDETSGA